MLDFLVPLLLSNKLYSFPLGLSDIFFHNLLRRRELQWESFFWFLKNKASKETGVSLWRPLYFSSQLKKQTGGKMKERISLSLIIVTLVVALYGTLAWGAEHKAEAVQAESQKMLFICYWELTRICPQCSI